LKEISLFPFRSYQTYHPVSKLTYSLVDLKTTKEPRLMNTLRAIRLECIFINK
jgi:hypothetical protein